MRKYIVKEIGPVSGPMITADSRSAISARITLGNPCGPMILTYSRLDALADGRQFELTRYTRPLGVRIPVFASRAVWISSIKVREAIPFLTAEICANELLTSFLKQSGGIALPIEGERSFRFTPRNAGLRVPLRYTVICGPLDIDDPAPALTILLGEDYAWR